ncbi:hypothetical protein DBR32_07650 [Taibaiella sp. KBW10]|nr:hypothetical protein DBR32_07650 [Taibaiella sp. KBW10]
MGLENSVLNVFENMAFQSDYDNIVALMKTSGMTLKSNVKDEKGNHMLAFDTPQEVAFGFCYAANKKLVYIRMDLPVRYAANLEPVIKELREKGFKDSILHTNTFTDEPMMVTYHHQEYPYEFVLYNVYPDVLNLFFFNTAFGNIEQYKHEYNFGSSYNK